MCSFWFVLFALFSFFFFFNDTATTEIYTLSLHDALPSRPAVSLQQRRQALPGELRFGDEAARRRRGETAAKRSLLTTGYKDDGRRRRLCGKLVRHRKTVDSRKLHVEQNDLRTEAPDLLESRLAVGRFAEDLEAICFEQGPSAGAETVVVINYEDRPRDTVHPPTHATR